MFDYDPFGVGSQSDELVDGDIIPREADHGYIQLAGDPGDQAHLTDFVPVQSYPLQPPSGICVSKMAARASHGMLTDDDDGRKGPV